MNLEHVTIGFLLAASAAATSRAQVISPIKALPNESVLSAAVDGTGSVVYGLSSSNQLGTNPGYLTQIFRFDPLSGAATQVTSFAAGVKSVSVTDDGQWLAFISEGDLTGANHDESAELFIMHPDGTGLAQLTSDTSLAGDGIAAAVISGSGNRVLFASDTDPLGTNPLRKETLFVVDRDGSGLVQLGEVVTSGYTNHPIDISDDGSRIAFLAMVGPYYFQAFTIDADGSNLQQRTSLPDGVNSVFVSGNGAKLVLVPYDNTDGFIVENWDGTGAVTMAPLGFAQGITDDGATAFYGLTAGQIRKTGTDGTGDALVVANAGSLAFSPLAVSGDGSRLAATARGGAVPGGNNPDGRPELVAMNASGGDQRQLTNLALDGGSGYRLQLLSNATRMFFQSTANYTGGNPQHGQQIFTILPNGTGLTQVTNVAGAAHDYSASDAASLVFDSTDDVVVGSNGCHAYQIFRQNPGGSPVQLTNACPGGDLARFPAYRFDGQWVVFQGTFRVGSNLDGSAELMKIKPDGTGLAPITADDSSTIKNFRLSASATTTWIVYSSDENKDGGNPSGRYQISRITLDGTSRQRITTDPLHDSGAPDVSGDGNKIVWSSDGDFAGENSAHVVQVFLYDVPTSSYHQLTHDACGAGSPRITRNGAWVYYDSCTSFDRIAVSTGVVERVQGFGAGHPEGSADGTGAKTALLGSDLVGVRTDAVFFVDHAAKPKFNVGKASPTLLSWDPDPQSTRYDVVRGTVANLAFNGSTVDLGAVVCLENDSPDNDTAGFEDAVDPAPGQAFFYVYRGTVGDPPVTGSYGLGTGNRERVASSGGCNP